MADKKPEARGIVLNKNLVLGAVILVVLILGVYLGTQLQTPSSGTATEKIETERQAEQTTTDIGNKLVGAAGTIDKIVNAVK